MRVGNLFDLGLIIRDRRRALGLGQEQLAQRVGASRKWIVGVENGKPHVDAGRLLEALRALGLVVLVEPTADSAPPHAEPANLLADVDIDAVVENARGRDGR